jgi:threonine dehydratase
VAWAARHVGLDACVVVPVTAPRTKVDGCRALGARVVAHGETYDDAVGEARRIAASEGRRFVHAFDDPDVIAGQGTVGVEMRPLEPDVVVVPIGGGGLAAGIAMAMDCRVVGVQVEGVDAMIRAIRGEEGPWEPAATVADGLRVRRAGVLTRRICRWLDGMVRVRVGVVRRAVAGGASGGGVGGGGGGAAAVAALEKGTGRRKAAVVSGGNIDGRRLVELCAEQWTKSGSPA